MGQVLKGLENEEKRFEFELVESKKLMEIFSRGCFSSFVFLVRNGTVKRPERRGN